MDNKFSQQHKHSNSPNTGNYNPLNLMAQQQNSQYNVQIQNNSIDEQSQENMQSKILEYDFEKNQHKNSKNLPYIKERENSKGKQIQIQKKSKFNDNSRMNLDIRGYKNSFSEQLQTPPPGKIQQAKKIMFSPDKKFENQFQDFIYNSNSQFKVQNNNNNKNSNFCECGQYQILIQQFEKNQNNNIQGQSRYNLNQDEKIQQWLLCKTCVSFQRKRTSFAKITEEKKGQNNQIFQNNLIEFSGQKTKNFSRSNIHLTTSKDLQLGEQENIQNSIQNSKIKSKHKKSSKINKHERSNSYVSEDNINIDFQEKQDEIKGIENQFQNLNSLKFNINNDLPKKSIYYLEQNQDSNRKQLNLVDNQNTQLKDTKKEQNQQGIQIQNSSVQQLNTKNCILKSKQQISQNKDYEKQENNIYDKQGDYLQKGYFSSLEDQQQFINMGKYLDNLEKKINSQKIKATIKSFGLLYSNIYQNQFNLDINQSSLFNKRKKFNQKFEKIITQSTFQMQYVNSSNNTNVQSQTSQNNV
ncbi:hypothetical protein PPERSA_03038 [Pseudocohnilembus persalinus]|uniref:Uncharacterized protein n=1 Tax=Pseudocohnilembus persalinus TaxID=266149 RepID=A0A0V0QEY3_PSEPJ|nr:hypothetical protein PPERSA_03038 [Pseudocohnilembus persalinus]|eukprot:KRX00778.1 hypothetical protein PPERSA_03038 [Pseudocohnilembus persalinus]